MKQKQWKIITKYCIICIMMVCIYSGKVQAANPSRVSLEPGVLYSSYDITGDGVPDKIDIVTYSSGKYEKDELKIYVNDKIAYQIKNKFFSSITMELCTLQNGKVYIYLYAAWDDDNGPVCGMFQYENGTLKKVFDFQTFYKYGRNNFGTIMKVSENSIKVNLFSMSWIMGPLEMQYILKVKKGRLCVDSNKGKVMSTVLRFQNKSYFTSAYAIKVYKNAVNSKKKFTLKKGDKVKITACYVNKSNIRFQIKTKGGKTGWIKSPKKYLHKDTKNGYIDGYFKESYYAG